MFVHSRFRDSAASLVRQAEAMQASIAAGAVQCCSCFASKQLKEADRGVVLLLLACDAAFVCFFREVGAYLSVQHVSQSNDSRVGPKLVQAPWTHFLQPQTLRVSYVDRCYFF